MRQLLIHNNYCVVVITDGSLSLILHIVFIFSLRLFKISEWNFLNVMDWSLCQIEIFIFWCLIFWVSSISWRGKLSLSREKQLFNFHNMSTLGIWTWGKILFCKSLVFSDQGLYCKHGFRISWKCCTVVEVAMSFISLWSVKFINILHFYGCHEVDYHIIDFWYLC